LPDEDPNSDEAWFQEPEIRRCIVVTNDYPGGFWEDYGYNWFSGS
jgi:DMSO/TMAO reductase YedYZ molybdopterin-dependent catalytic subunit